MARHLSALRQLSVSRCFGLALSGSILVIGAHGKSAQARPARKALKNQAARATKVSPQRASEEKLPGAWAWTSAAQTYLRVRPGAQTPAIAKVPARTKMFVWGKYDGWYRVETIGHKFGWVFHEHLNCPKAHKIATLSPRKAKIASNRASNQVMYGSPALLQRYYARYGGSGAVRGLAKQGVRLAARDNQKTIQKSLTIQKPKTTTSKRLATKTAAKSVVAKTIVKKPTIIAARPVAAAPRLVESPSATSAAQPRISPPRISSPRVTQRPSRSTARRIASLPTPPKVALANSIKPKTIETAPKTELIANPFAPRGLPSQMTVDGAVKTEAADKTEAVANPFAPRGLPPQMREEFSKTRPTATPAERLVARPEATPRNWEGQTDSLWNHVPDVASEAPVEGAMTILDDGNGPTKSNAPLKHEASALSPSLPLNAVQSTLGKPATTRSAARPRAASRPQTAAKKLTPSQQRARLRAQKREQRVARARAQLRSRLGTPRMTVPPLATNDLRPISPEELMQARESFLSSRHKTSPDASRTPAESSDRQGRAPSPNTSAAIQPSSWNGLSDSSFAISTTPLQQEADSDFGLMRYGAVLRFATRATQVVQTAPRPASRPVISRGGSPRDAWLAMQRAKAGQNTTGSLFGQTMAKQALAYRGMPYIRGASSPARGFDCSGLIYFLLRQRGFSPPRTAAGLASYGRSVPRNQLQSGDIVLFANTYKRGISHVGIYVGNGNFVHAANSHAGVRVDALNSAYYGRKYHGARRP